MVNNPQKKKNRYFSSLTNFFFFKLPSDIFISYITLHVEKAINQTDIV